MTEVQDAIKQYGDIIHLPCPRSKRHKPMSMLDRAAQFSPFAALTGYEESIDEAARFVEARPLLSEEQKLIVNEQLLRLQSIIKEKPAVRIRYFCQDQNKNGGKIVTVTERLCKMDPIEQTLLLESGLKLSFQDLLPAEDEE